MTRAIEHPRRVVPDADELGHDRIMSTQEPCLGRMVGACADGTPLGDRDGEFVPGDIDRDDPRPLRNVIMR